MPARAYPRSWLHRDPAAAARVLAASDYGPPRHREGNGHLIEIVGTVRGYPAQLSEWRQEHRSWIEAEFTVPPDWPMFTLIRSHGADGDAPPHSSGEIGVGWMRLPDVADDQLWTPAPAQVRALFGRGLGTLLERHPVERLRIGGPSAALRSLYGARLNAETAQWIADVIDTVLAGAPPYESLGLIDMAPGISWTEQRLDRDLGITPPDTAG